MPTRGEIVPWRGPLSGEKARRELGLVPRMSYEEALAGTKRYLAQLGLIKR